MTPLTAQELKEEINGKAQQLRALINELFDDYIDNVDEAEVLDYVKMNDGICDFLNID